MTTSSLIRLAQAAVAAFFGLYVAVVAFGNITDYHTNFLFVKHVMSMDTIFENSDLTYRAVTSPALHHAAYISIIILEVLVAAACLTGAVQLLRALNADTAIFHRAKRWSIAGLLGGLTLWFFVFQVIAGEWFAMWQSDTWNGLDAASRLTTYIGISLLLLVQKVD